MSAETLNPADHIASGDTLRVGRNPGPTVWLREMNNAVAAVWTQNGVFCDSRELSQREAVELIKIGDAVDHVEEPKSRIDDSLSEVGR